jgi:hypothetical protein
MIKFIKLIHQILFFKFIIKKNKIWKKMLMELYNGYKIGNIQDR